MNPIPLDKAKDPDFRKAMAAMIRAAQRARNLAAQTQTYLVVMRDGKLIEEIPERADRNESPKP